MRNMLRAIDELESSLIDNLGSVSQEMGSLKKNQERNARDQKNTVTKMRMPLINFLVDWTQLRRILRA